MLTSQTKLASLDEFRIRLNPDVMAQRVSEELVLVHLETNQIYELSSSAAKLWELLAAGHELNAAQARLAAEYEVESDRLEHDIRVTLSALAAARLIELEQK